MKLALITDQHFGARNDSLLFSDYFEKFYTEIWFPYLLKNNITNVVDLGDTFDRRKYVNLNILKKTKQMWFDKLKEYNINIHTLVGNHTTYFKNTSEVNTLNLILDSYDNVVVYDRPAVVEFDGVPIQFIPWINAGNYSQTMEALSHSPAQIAMGHLELSGFQMYRGQYSEGGWDKELFRRFDTVFSGHFHHKSDDGQIYYLGTPYQNLYQTMAAYHRNKSS